MKNKVILLCITAMLLISGACSGEDYDSNLISENMDKNSETTDNTLTSNKMNIKVGEKVLKVSLVENSSVDALKEALSEGSITVNMRDYGNMEKVGSLGRDFPRNDESITTEAGDVILFQGSALVIYYAPNTWSFTRLGKIDDISAEELKAVLGDGNVTVTLTLDED